MNKVNTLFFAISTTFLTSHALATDCINNTDCDVTITTNIENNTVNTTKNAVTTKFSHESAKAARRLQNVYQTVGTFSQNNSGDVYARGVHEEVITHKNGDVKLDVTAIGNNMSAELVGLRNVNLSVAQKNSGDITAENTVVRPYVSGNLEITTNAIGNNASVGWDLTTDKHPSDNSFDVKRDGALRSFKEVGTFVGSVDQCNTGDVTAILDYRQDPAANIQISTTAVGNNLSFGVKTR